MKAPPGHLTRQETDELLEPIRNFWVFRTDTVSFDVVWNIETWVCHGTPCKCFFYSVAGGYIPASTDLEIGLIELSNQSLPRLFIRPRSLAARLSWFFEGDRSLVAVKRPRLRRFLIYGAPADQAQAVLDPGFVRIVAEHPGPRLSIECAGRHLVIYRRTTRGQRSPHLRPILESLLRVLTTAH